MSRQILSYSDLDTTTTITTRTVEVPNPNARRPEAQQMGPPKKKRKTNAAHNRQTSMSTGMNQSSTAQALDDWAAEPHWDTAPTSDATVTLVYAENEPGSSNPHPEVGQETNSSLVGPLNPTPGSVPPTIGSQFVGAPMTLLQSFPPHPRPTPPYQSVVPSPAPAEPSQRPNNAKEKKGRGKALPSKGNAAVPKIPRHLAHEEIWDDSALVDAWDAAMDQYRRMNGGKGWSAVPVKESPLWYNVPPDESDSESDVEGEQDMGESIEETAPKIAEEPVQGESVQLPARRMVLAGVAGTSDTSQVAQTESLNISNSASLLPAADSGIPIRDYAFQKAKEASYALGYWTAIYELQSQEITKTTVGEASPTPESTNQLEDEAEESSFVPTQR